MNMTGKDEGWRVAGDPFPDGRIAGVTTTVLIASNRCRASFRVLPSPPLDSSMERRESVGSGIGSSGDRQSDLGRLNLQAIPRNRFRCSP